MQRKRKHALPSCIAGCLQPIEKVFAPTLDYIKLFIVEPVMANLLSLACQYFEKLKLNSGAVSHKEISIIFLMFETIVKKDLLNVPLMIIDQSKVCQILKYCII